MKPNILFIYTDEQRYDTLSCYGNDRLEMPNLNRFAESATVFEQTYVTQPVCTPSRSTLLTGLYPHTNGMTENNNLLRDDIRCLPEMLPRGMYTCGHHGKWHLGNEIFAQHGFTDWIGIDDGYHKYYTDDKDPEARSSYHHWLRAQGVEPRENNRFGRAECTRLPEHLGKPAYLAGEACRFLQENKDNPFCLFVNFFEPHMPYFGPRDNQYNPDTFWPPELWDDPPDESCHLKTRALRNAYAHKKYYEWIFDMTNEGDWKKLRANYMGLCSLVDTHAGTILNCLNDLGLDENTIVVYTSDHGDMMGDHQLMAKCVMYEQSSRVPLLIRMPGQNEQHRVKGPVSHIDLLPTLLDAMDVEAPSGLQGESLKDLLTGGTNERDVFIEWNGPNNGFGDVSGSVKLEESMLELATGDEIQAAMTDPVRTIVTPDNWKFNCSPLGMHELYDLNSDPGECRNLATDPEQKPRMNEYLSRIQRWQRMTGDTANVPDTIP